MSPSSCSEWDYGLIPPICLMLANPSRDTLYDYWNKCNYLIFPRLIWYIATSEWGTKWIVFSLKINASHSLVKHFSSKKDTKILVLDKQSVGLYLVIEYLFYNIIICISKLFCNILVLKSLRWFSLY